MLKRNAESFISKRLCYIDGPTQNLFWSDLHLIKNSIQNSEESLSRFLTKMKVTLCDEVQNFEEQQHHLEESRKVERCNLEKSLHDVKSKVAKLNHLLNESSNSEHSGLEIFKEQIWVTINLIKKENIKTLQVLSEEEDQLTEEILTVGQWIEDWSHNLAESDKQRTLHSSLNYKTSGKRNLPIEVLEFENFVLEHGGHEGGWDSKDHQLFLILRKKCKALCFISEAAKKLYARTEVEIIEHEKWYQEYLEKRERKITAVQNWKVEKEDERKRSLEHREELARLRSKQVTKDIRKKTILRQEKLTALLEWKNKKELQRLEEEKKKQKEQIDKRERFEKKMKLKEEMLKTAEEHRQEKKRLEEELINLRKRIEAREQSERAKQAKEQIMRFQQRDKKIMNSKREKEIAIQEEKQKLEQRLESLKKRVNFHVDRDPDRLQKLTAAWRERNKYIGPSGMNRPIHLPHRIIPEWRKSLY